LATGIAHAFVAMHALLDDRPAHGIAAVFDGLLLRQRERLRNAARHQQRQTRKAMTSRYGHGGSPIWVMFEQATAFGLSTKAYATPCLHQLSGPVKRGYIRPKGQFGAIIMKSIVVASCLLALALTGETAHAGNVLINQEEASLPAPPTTASVSLVTRGITRKPNVILTSPEASVSSPFNLQFKFEAHGGSKIKPNTFRIVYMRTPNVDLTARVKPFLTADGVEMTGAEVPPGQHMIKVTIADSENREGSAVFTLNVLK
jgi:hypothetical protein